MRAVSWSIDESGSEQVGEVGRGQIIKGLQGHGEVQVQILF